MAERFGLSSALATPFDEGGQVDLDMMVRHAGTCLRNGCRSVTLFGTTGEGASLGSAQRGEVLAAFARSGIDLRAKVIACVAQDSMEDAAAQARDALDRGCRGILLCPPHYFKTLSDDGVFAWFSGVFTRLGSAARGIYLYHIPPVTGVAVSPEVVTRLRQAFPGVVAGIKDSSGDRDTAMRFLEAHRDIDVLIGDERLLAEAVRHGAQGAISGLANVLPERMAALIDSAQDSPAISELTDAVLRCPVVPAVKVLVARRWDNPAWLRVRPPLLPLPDEAAQELRATHDRLFSAGSEGADGR